MNSLRWALLIIFSIGFYTILSAAEHVDKFVIQNNKDCITNEYLSYALPKEQTLSTCINWFKAEGTIAQKIHYDKVLDVIFFTTTCINKTTKAKVEISLFYKIVEGDCVVSNKKSYFIVSFYFNGGSKEFYDKEARQVLSRFVTEDDYDIILEGESK